MHSLLRFVQEEVGDGCTTVNLGKAEDPLFLTFYLLHQFIIKKKYLLTWLPLQDSLQLASQDATICPAYALELEHTAVPRGAANLDHQTPLPPAPAGLFMVNSSGKPFLTQKGWSGALPPLSKNNSQDFLISHFKNSF